LSAPPAPTPPERPGLPELINELERLAARDAPVAPEELARLAALARARAADGAGAAAAAPVPPLPPAGAAPRLRDHYGALVGKSAPMQALYQLLDRIADSDATVLVQGANGTGKELVAHAIHDGSARAAGPFVVQNCSAFNDNLLDSELFGHRRGAFTGAVADKRGLFEAAHGGTFFLDEIGDMSPALQVKLLRVLQEGTFTPVGDTAPRQVDVRVVAATHRDLRAMVAEERFREDLFYRINVIVLGIAPLRERPDDVPLLVEHFLGKHSPRLRRRLARDTLARLMDHDWPGNVRELEHEIERLCVLAGTDTVLRSELLSRRIREGTAPLPAARRAAAAAAVAAGTQALSDDPGAVAAKSTAAGRTRGLPQAVESLERALIADALRRQGGNKTRAAQELRISRRNLIRKVAAYGLDAKRTRG
jgi:transcriptional regulator with PAS, ATPase and Fis domain